ncbi:PREDICTED: uncharacterized zinc finger protein CG2678-like [Papilio xuthus]|uniref:Uncharacterized zinc finger protein CG2678-like n=1 Tax=Papilio xuthus TaxID=66420 RepID=A0AAJ6ZGP8_PAPXU|nr:PREDICTED: uncharacterized zinc finger protein CG2678-like [Papilio xuthus]
MYSLSGAAPHASARARTRPHAPAPTTPLCLIKMSERSHQATGRKSTPRHSIMTRSKKINEESGNTTTLAILKNVTSANSPPEDAKENKRQAQPVAAPPAPTAPAAPATPPAPVEVKQEARYNVFPRGGSQLPCAQYKTDKGYRCPNCQRCYNARKNLVRHVTLECGREPQYKCPHCAYSKHRRNELKKHIEKKHPASPHAAARAAPHAPHAPHAALVK